MPITEEALPPLHTLTQIKEALDEANGAHVLLRIDPNAAQELLNDQPPHYQRPLDTKIVSKYERHMKAGRWQHELPDNIMIMSVDGHMIDGQHRCHAAVRVQKSFGAWWAGSRPAMEIKYLGQTMHRRTHQTLKMFHHASAKQLEAVCRMFMCWELGESPLAPMSIAPDEAEEILSDFPDIPEWIAEAAQLRHAIGVVMPPPSLMAYMIGRMRVSDRRLAPRFLDALRSGSMLTETDPPMLLRRLWATKIRGRSMADRLWYHNSTARAWHFAKKGGGQARLKPIPRTKLLPW